MAGLEVVVRPLVFPNIRPSSPRVLPPEDDPTKGQCEIGSSGGKIMTVTHTFTFSYSREKPHREKVRQEDKRRVYQKEKDDTINKNNYIDVMIMKKVRLDKSDGSYKMLYSDPPKADNVEVLETDVTTKS